MADSLITSQHRRIVALRERFQANGADEQAAFCDRILRGLERSNDN